MSSRILVVDDDVALAEMIGIVLEGEGYTVSTCPDGAKAVAAFQEELRTALAQAGDPQRAEQQRAYLKSQMPMYGVGVPATRRLATRIAAAHADLWHDATTWETALRHLWDGATYREERFATLAIIRSTYSAAHAECM